MNININEVRTCFQTEMGFRLVVEQTGELAERSVKVLKQALEYVRQDVRLAGITVAVANVMFLETAVLVAGLADCILVRYLGPEEKWSKRTISVNSFVILSLAFSLLIGMNIALYQGLKLPLNPLVTVAISIASCASCMLFHMWRAGGKEVEEG